MRAGLSFLTGLRPGGWSASSADIPVFEEGSDCAGKRRAGAPIRRLKAGKAGAGNKPGSVEGNHSSGTAVTGRLEQPTRESARNRRRGPRPAYSPIWSCSGRGLPCREPLPAARCALTAPFHPYRPKPAVCFLWHFPWARTLQALPGALSEGARTFLHSPANESRTNSDCLADSGVSDPSFYRIRPSAPQAGREISMKNMMKHSD